MIGGTGCCSRCLEVQSSHCSLSRPRSVRLCPQEAILALQSPDSTLRPPTSHVHTEQPPPRFSRRHSSLTPLFHSDVPNPLVALVRSSRAMSKLVRMLLSALHSEQVTSPHSSSHTAPHAHPAAWANVQLLTRASVVSFLGVRCSGNQQVGSVSADAAVRSDGAQRSRAGQGAVTAPRQA